MRTEFKPIDSFTDELRENISPQTGELHLSRGQAIMLISWIDRLVKQVNDQGALLAKIYEEMKKEEGHE